jgi:hypothetical protein
MSNTDLWVNNADLLQYTQVHVNVILDNTSRLKPRELVNINIPAPQFKLILEDIGEWRHKLSDKQKEFAYSFIKSVMNRPSITSKQCAVLRSIQKQCSPNYLKQPKFFKKVCL